MGRPAGVGQSERHESSANRLQRGRVLTAPRGPVRPDVGGGGTKPDERPAPAIPPRRQLVALWLVAATVLGALLVVSRAARSGGDDPDQARQRAGFLDSGALPVPAPGVAGIPRPGRRAVVFFVREDQAGELCRQLAGSRPIRARANVAVVVAGTVPSACPGGRVIGDAGGAIAGAYGLAVPRDGGPPTGYAVVDSEGAVRYRTLDPGVVDRLGEVAIILRATP